MDKVFLKLLLCCSILSACATLDGQSGRRTVDMTHVNAINQQAVFRNTDIIWVNPPTKIEGQTKTTIRSTLTINDGEDVPATEPAEEKDPQQR